KRDIIMNTIDTPLITRARLDEAYSYSSYRELMEDLVDQKSTTGPNKSEDMAYYTALNHQRMKRLDKTLKIDDDLAARIAAIDHEQTWVVITESWCGDAAQNVPVIEKLASLNDQIELKLFLRDENLDIMDSYLTNGSRSIPKLVIFKRDNMKELGTWGPRPAALQEIYDAWRNDPNKVPYKEFNVTIQKWYAKDKAQEMQKELMEVFQ
ncbi:MAG: thioredoxin family protein, partial [Bacteroidota bacterium]